MRFVIWFVAGLLSWVPLIAVAAWAQGPPPQASCEERLDNANFQTGGLMQQLAVATAQLRTMTKERDDAKAALAKASELPKK